MFTDVFLLYDLLLYVDPSRVEPLCTFFQQTHAPHVTALRPILRMAVEEASVEYHVGGLCVPCSLPLPDPEDPHLVRALLGLQTFLQVLGTREAIESESVPVVMLVYDTVARRLFVVHIPGPTLHRILTQLPFLHVLWTSTSSDDLWHVDGLHGSAAYATLEDAQRILPFINDPFPEERIAVIHFVQTHCEIVRGSRIKAGIFADRVAREGLALDGCKPALATRIAGYLEDTFGVLKKRRGAGYFYCDIRWREGAAQSDTSDRALSDRVSSDRALSDREE